MITKYILTSLLILTSIATLRAQSSSVNSQYLDYIERYSELAREQQSKHGIPASITLAQGLLESRAGLSTLASEGNNHFGIKCHSSWTGPTMLRDDDAPDECFRVYSSASESFDDHSRFLHGRRYQRLFDLDPTDYASWAHGLRECGYATDPNYGYKLISIIERYRLFSYDGDFPHSPKGADDDASFILSELKTSHAVRRSRGLHYVIAVPGDSYASIAAEFGMDGNVLAHYNDSGSATDAIKAWEEVYLQPKLPTAPSNVKRVTIGEDESAHSVAQRYGVTMQLIHDLNPNFKDAPGTILRLK